MDNRIRILIENGVAERQRSLFVVVGDRGKDQVRPGKCFVSCPKVGRLPRPFEVSAYGGIRAPRLVKCPVGHSFSTWKW